MKNNNSSKLSVATKYGVAFSSLLVANELQADIETITWNGGESKVVLSIGQSGTSIRQLDLDQLPNVFGNNFEFEVRKSALSSCFGDAGTICGRTSNASIRRQHPAIVGIGSFDAGDAIPSNLGESRLFFPGKEFVGFVTADGGRGWFRVDDIPTATTYGSGQFATEGEDLIAGVFVTADPCAPAFDLLNGALTINGTDGNDLIEVSNLNGQVTARLNDCVEQFTGPINEVEINGNDGADEISVTLSFNSEKTIRGGRGDDTITVSGPGTADIFGEGGSDTIVGGPGNDFIQGGRGDDYINGRGGADLLSAGPDMNTIIGGPGADRILGGSDVDIVIGGGGDDEINTYAGDDMILGGAGIDFIQSDVGEDMIAGGGGNDVIFSSHGADLVDGGLGNDTIDGGPEADVITGGSGSDDIFGGQGNDTIHGNAGLDLLRGGPGEDEIFGGVGNDIISGGLGNDTLHGQAQHDIVNGDGGDDTITGGLGNDEFNGGAGVDTATDTGEAGETSIEN